MAGVMSSEGAGNLDFDTASHICLEFSVFLFLFYIYVRFSKQILTSLDTLSFYFFSFTWPYTPLMIVSFIPLCALALNYI